MVFKTSCQRTRRQAELLWLCLHMFESGPFAVCVNAVSAGEQRGTLTVTSLAGVRSE